MDVGGVARRAMPSRTEKPYGLSARRFEVPAQLTASPEQELQIDAALKILSR
jgi:hypothetical protein